MLLLVKVKFFEQSKWLVSQIFYQLAAKNYNAIMNIREFVSISWFKMSLNKSGIILNLLHVTQFYFQFFAKEITFYAENI